MWTKKSEGLTKMKQGDIIERHYRNDVMYECYDETDPAHCINIGSFDNLEKPLKLRRSIERIFQMQLYGRMK